MWSGKQPLKLSRTYLPSRFSEVLLELLRYGAMNVLVTGSIAGNPARDMQKAT